MAFISRIRALADAQRRRRRKRRMSKPLAIDGDARKVQHSPPAYIYLN